MNQKCEVNFSIDFNQALNGKKVRLYDGWKAVIECKLPAGGYKGTYETSDGKKFNVVWDEEGKSRVNSGLSIACMWENKETTTYKDKQYTAPLKQVFPLCYYFVIKFKDRNLECLMDIPSTKEVEDGRVFSERQDALEWLNLIVERNADFVKTIF